MGTRTNRVWASVAGGVAAAVLLAGCSAGGAGGAGEAGGEKASPSPTAPETSGPATTPPPEAESPVTELGVDCAGLLAAGTAAAVDASWLPRDYYDRATVEPADYAIAQEGGLSCTWNNGAPSDGKNNDTGGGGYSGLLVQALPHAGDTWLRFVEIYGEDADFRCFGDQDFRGCTSDRLIGDTWVSIIASGFDLAAGVTSEEAFAPVVSEVTEVVSGAVVADEPWPLSGPVRPWSCGADGALEGEALGTTADLYVLTPNGGWSIYAAAWSTAMATLCSIMDDTTRVSGESVLTGGAWALDQRIEFGLVDPDSAVTVPGLASGDRAYRSCSADECVTDLVLGDDWARLSVPSSAVADVEAASGRLAEAYVARAAATA